MAKVSRKYSVMSGEPSSRILSIEYYKRTIYIEEQGAFAAFAFLFVSRITIEVHEENANVG